MSSIPRLVAVTGAFAGALHLLVPERLLGAAGWAYDRLLAVEFEPRENATARVRAVGLLFVVGSALALRAGRE